jgi:hypothetical protein
MRKTVIVAGTVVALMLSACGKADGADSAPRKAGPDGSRSFVATGFTGVELAGSDNVVVTRGESFSVVATGPQDVLDKLDIRVNGGVLEVRRKPSAMNWSSDNGATIAVTLPRLDSATLSGSGGMTIDSAAGDAVALALSGSGDMKVAAVATKALDIALAGSGDLSIAGGKADSGDVSLAGSGDIDMKGVTMTTADIALAGSGDINATATGTADVSIVGSGDVRIAGGAKCDSSELGSGTATCG